MQIRDVKKKDREQLLKLHQMFHIGYHRQELLSKSPILPIIEYTDSNSAMKHAVDEMYDGSHISFVAEENGKIVAFISGKIIDLADKVNNKEGYIDDWFVINEFRSKGVGKRLYKVLCQEFERKGSTHLSISAYAENKKALEFYRKLGFRDFTITLKKKVD